MIDNCFAFNLAKPMKTRELGRTGLIMKTMIICLLLPAILLGCSKKASEASVESQEPPSKDGKVKLDGENVVAFPKLPEFQQVTLKVLRWEERDLFNRRERNLPRRSSAPARDRRGFQPGRTGDNKCVQACFQRRRASSEAVPAASMAHIEGSGTADPFTVNAGAT